MKFKSKQECLNSISRSYDEFSNDMKAASFIVRSISITVTAVAVVAWIIIFILCATHFIPWWTFITFTLLLLTFRIAHSSVTNRLVNNVVTLVVKDIVEDNLSRFPEYDEMPDWMQKEFVENEVNEIFK